MEHPIWSSPKTHGPLLWGPYVRGPTVLGPYYVALIGLRLPDSVLDSVLFEG